MQRARKPLNIVAGRGIEIRFLANGERKCGDRGGIEGNEAATGKAEFSLFLNQMPRPPLSPY